MRSLALALTALVCTVVSTAAATEYFGIDQFSGGDVTLALDLWDPYFVDTDTYHVHRFDWSVTNDGSDTYYDVKLVLPFAWLKVDAVLRAYSYADATGDWHWADATDDFNLEPDQSAYTPTPAPLSYILMSDTDLPLLTVYGGKTASALSTDSVPTWDITLTLGPSETATFTTYLKQETDSRVSGLWISPYTVGTVPEPATMALAALGLSALLLRMRKR
ncbi:MAG: PEP-CTERM sorting domain-containing protein [Verrucomicrobia bacterium]|nr:PEP-CTERM sorting domain-containing protein [Verrucomicrobiota bacterium]